MRKISFVTRILIGGLLLAGLTVNNAYAGKPDKPGKPDEPYEGSVVEITGSSGEWKLKVDDDEDFFIEGLCFGPDISRRTIDGYMTQVVELGANTVRTWGTGGETKVLLDAAQEQEIKVCMGIWLQHFIAYADNEGYKNHTLSEISTWVEKYKNHPAVLMWNVGNEVILHLDQYFDEDTGLEEHRIAYAEFVEQICQKIHSIDPNHPVTSSSTRLEEGKYGWDYYIDYTPSLDIYAMNIYKLLFEIQDKWESLPIDKPYIITEFGPDGEWEIPKEKEDHNGVVIESSDTVKAEAYYNGWTDHIFPNKGCNLGGFPFIYGEKEDFGGVWFNLLMSGKKRPSFYSVKEMYGKGAGDNNPPVISSMLLSKSPDLDPNIVRLTVDASDPDEDLLSYEVKLCGRDVTGDERLYLADFEQLGEGVFNVTVPDTEGIYKIYIFVTDGMGNIGIETRSMKVGT